MPAAAILAAQQTKTSSRVLKQTVLPRLNAQLVRERAQERLEKEEHQRHMDGERPSEIHIAA